MCTHSLAQDVRDDDHYCRYDSDGKHLWHNLAAETWERIPPTPARLEHLSVPQLKACLRTAGLPITGRKGDLISRVLPWLRDTPHPDATPGARPSRLEIVELAKFGEAHATRMERIGVKASDIQGAQKERAGGSVATCMRLRARMFRHRNITRQATRLAGWQRRKSGGKREPDAAWD